MEQTKKCPHCGGEILAVAKKCKHCGTWLEPQVSKPVNQGYKHKEDKETIKGYLKIAIIVFVILALFILIKVLSSPMGQNMLK